MLTLIMNRKTNIYNLFKEEKIKPFALKEYIITKSYATQAPLDENTWVTDLSV